ncbi:hypothetical protein [Fodinicola acaciae]|uniref:hypothetical protein n=1 Tax=Fodinicola acaciae TaxID=2681555 RepID=UPI0013D08C55|nr:hypothetical protein [Fodinicola acaciae]
MSRNTYYIAGDLPYYAIACDTCGASFTCYDDSCYQWNSLCATAEYAGWRLADDGRGPHLCPDCVASTSPRRLATT